MRFVWITLFISMNFGCSLFEKKETSLEVSNLEQPEVQNIEKVFVASQNQEVLLLTEAFQTEHPYSSNLQKVRFIKAGALENLERWTEAADIYNIISKFSARNQPKISALSIYRLSFVYEALGDDQRVLTTLLEAEKYQDHLPMEVVLAEIPSRIAMVYAKENNSSESSRWLAKADKGLRQVLDNRNKAVTDNWLAKTYFNMGSISTNQLSAENILAIIQGQAAVQKYLIRALQFGDETWSSKAEAKLLKNYSDIWREIENLQEPSGYDSIVAAKMKRDEQLRLAFPFSELIKDAQLYLPLPEVTTNNYQRSFFSHLEALQVRTESLLQNPIYTPLTIRRNKAAQELKNSVKVIKSEDPNL